MNKTQNKLLAAADKLSEECGELDFSSPVSTVYNPLRYAREGYKKYLELMQEGKKELLFVGMNPGPWGMAQTGVPFGEIEAVKQWMGIQAEIGRPKKIHPKRPVKGFQCSRREISGKRFWGLMHERYGEVKNFFASCFTANYCPLLFFQEDGKNQTPDKLNKRDREALFAVCDAHINTIIDLLNPHWVVGIGNFASKRIEAVLDNGRKSPPKHLTILHPSPASPKANKGWAEAVTNQLAKEGIWTE
jgi:single-strand selective monofunctional uracil DNA glycosylase